MYLNGGTKVCPNWQANRLTLTWDVFKSVYYFPIKTFAMRLTLTWDVFKLMPCSNCSCISIRLTLTWDVFKWN